MADIDAPLSWRMQQDGYLMQIDQLKSDNDKLRHDLEEANKQAEEVCIENEKLRKLVKRMHRHIKQTCDVCDEYYCSNFDEENECCVFDVLAREMGLEEE